jgi:23S rRNA pseudouridine2605 synthase
MCDAIGYPVTRLVRTRIGPIVDRKIAPGHWRKLTDRELRLIIAAVTEQEAQ